MSGNIKLTAGDNDSRVVGENYCWELPGGNAVVLHVYDIYHFRTIRFPIRLGDGGTTLTADGLTLSVDHGPTGVALNVEFRVERNQLRVTVPFASIKERKSYQWLLEGVEILPDFGRQPKGAPGYLVWPNYSGVTCEFNKDEATEFRDTIYSDNSRWENFTSMPLFGVVTEGKAFLAIFQQGQFEAELIHRLAKGPEKWHSTTPLFRFRYHPRQEISPIDREIIYAFFDGPRADYVEMAKFYRQYLLEYRHLAPLKEKIRETPSLDYAMRSQWLKIFCAEKVHHRDGLGEFQKYTTFDEAREILRELKKRGIDKITCMLVGWNTEGHDGRFPDRWPPEERLGGLAKARELVRWGKENGLKITVHDNYVDAFARAGTFAETDAMRDQYGFKQVVGIWAGGESYRLRPEASLRAARRDLPRIKDELGVEGCYYIDAVSLGPEPDYAEDGVKGRKIFADGQLAVIDEARRLFGCCQVENSIDYTFDAAAACASVVTEPFRLGPLVTPIKDNMTAFIPFFQIAWHGIILYHHFDLFACHRNMGGARKAMLRELSWGALGRVEMTYQRHPEFACLKDTDMLEELTRQYRLLSVDTVALQTEFIQDYRQVGDEIFETEYEGGTVVRVDYNQLTYDIRRADC